MDEATQQKLADLDSTFNTNPGFGLMGMLGQQEQQHQQPQQQQQADPDPDGKPPEWFDLLNQTIQTKSKRDEELISSLSNKLGTIESRISQPQQQQIQQDPGEELDPAAIERRQIFANQAQIVVDSSFDRGRNALARIKAQDPSTDLTEADLKAAFDLNGLQNNPDLARRMDWDLYFDAENKKRQAPKLSGRVKELEAEIQLLKSGRGIENMASVPRSNRVVTPSNASNDNGIDDDVYKAASARMGKGRFSGFGRALFEEQQKKQRRVAV